MANVNSSLEQIERWSLFELHRFNCAITKLLSDPERNDAIKRQLKVGMQITYFCSDKNTLVEAIVDEIRKARASVINIHDGQQWDISFFLINLEGIDTRIVPKKYSSGLDRNSLKVGDLVMDTLSIQGGQLFIEGEAIR
ncbi:hypothetical protein [Legionella qingyii]|uniref:Uncharacterized protein n=1 Tax=Legionella qingyii TaxID=2184757 RepID=A0ABY0CGP2_9GAMM|nr:hypothetical protein [Legionella qingyii]RUR22074.1 hypothetical protein ELY20_10965 [Legionella qingyii]RUR25654.1 hypothetical protein ELY16_09775 [Legionella qingyii]